jgi:tetratricopeptide (TPR) repeat protein
MRRRSGPPSGREPDRVGRLLLLALLSWGTLPGTLARADTQQDPCQLADALFSSGEIEQARTEYVDVLKQDPSSRCAAKGLSRINQTSPSPPPTSCQDADALFDAGDLAAARSAYLALPGDTACVTDGLASIRDVTRECQEGRRLLDAHRRDDALAAYKKALETNPEASCAQVGVQATGPAVLTRTLTTVSDALPLILVALLILGVVVLGILLLGHFRRIGAFFARVPIVGNWLRPRLTIASLDDDAVGFKVGGPMAGRIKERLQSFREAALRREIDDYDLDIDDADEEFAELVSADDSGFRSALNKLSAAADQTKVLAGIADLLFGMLPITRLTIAGVIEPPDPTGAALTISLERNARLLASARLAGKALDQDPKAGDYLQLSEEAAVWTQYVVACALKREPVDELNAKSFALARAGVGRQLDGDEAGAQGFYEQAIELNPRNWAARVNLALLLARRANNFEVAIAMLEETLLEMEGA